MTITHKGRLAAGLVWIGMTTLLGGCHHRQAVPTLPPVLPQAVEAPPPAPDSPSMQSPPPSTVSTAPAVRVTPAKPKHTRKRSLPTPKVSAPPPPVETAATTPPAAQPAPIGALSAGGDATAKTQQDAAELIASIERRLAALPPATAAQQQAPVRSIRLFLTQSKDALATGDAEAARTLATKAKLLMDDLAK